MKIGELMSMGNPIEGSKHRAAGCRPKVQWGVIGVEGNFAMSCIFPFQKGKTARRTVRTVEFR